MPPNTSSLSKNIHLNSSFGLSSLTVPFSAAAIDHVQQDHKMDSNLLAGLDTNFISPSYSSNNDKCTAKTNSETAPVIARNPMSAAALYRDKKLWTDFDVGGSSVRVAFRYVLDSGTNPTDASSEQVYLCWIHSTGKPFHFYSMSPTSDSCEVNEDDHIETTYAGHGFVFCRLLDDDVTKEIVQRVKSGAIDSSQFENKDGICVVNEEWGTIFLRKMEIQESESDSGEESESEDKEEHNSDVEEKVTDCSGCGESDDDDASQVSVASHWSFIDKSESDAAQDGAGEDQDDDNSSLDEESTKREGLEGDWEAYWIVGGFRLGTRAVYGSDGQGYNEVAADSTAAKDDKGPESRSESDDYDDEWSIQLITLKQQKVTSNLNQIRPSLRGTQENSEESTTHHNFFSDNQFILLANFSKLDPTPVCSVNKRYDSKTLGGWPCRVEPGSLSHRKLRKRIIADLATASSRLPSHARDKLQKSTPVWINKSLAYGPKVAPIREANMCFHPGSSWLIRNGMNPAKNGGVEMYKSSAYLDDCHLWGVGGLMLHELSHAYHFLHCENGYDNSTIQECYDKAMEEGLYDCVPFHCSRGKKDRRQAYACTNAMEYFAELSAAFLGGLDDKEYNKWYPFNKEQIKEHDPRAFAMLCKMWGVTDDDYGKV